MREHGESGLAVAANGTQEVMLAVLSGTIANGVVLLPTFEAQPDTDAAQMQHIAKAVDAAIRSSVKPGWLLSTSTVVGAEPQDKSFGAARIFSQGMATVNLVDRFHRDETIFQINEVMQQKVRAIPGVIDANAVVYGATPLSSIRGTVDLMVSGPDWRVLDQIAGEIEARLAKVGGLTGFERSWQGDSKRLQLDVDAAKASSYGLTPGAIAQQVAAQVNGIPGGSLRVEGENSIPVWVRLRSDARSSPAAIAALNITAPNGAIVSLAQVATVKTVYAPTTSTHQNLVRTVDVIGYRRDIAVTALDAHVAEALKGLQLPRGYTLSDEGEMKEMNASFTRLGQSLALGRGVPLKAAILQAVDLRTRPIRMTAAAAAVGMIPVAFEWAVGLERLSPLAVVAIGGLIVGTFLTLLIVPVLLFLLLKRRYPDAAVLPAVAAPESPSA